MTAEAEEHCRRGFQLLTEGSYARSRDEFYQAIEVCPDFHSAYLGLGQTFLFQTKPDLPEAKRAFCRVIELRPKGGEGYHLLGTAQERSGATADAVHSYKRAVKLMPSDTRPLVALGACLIGSKRFGDAVMYLRRAVKLKPHYGEALAHLWLADALLGKGQKKAACEEWKLALTLPAVYPEHGKAHKEARERLKQHCGSI
jgi:Tfp pilus assembly protein PilF